ncbi:MAG: hypothetical protein EXR72_09760 [Myxococcales bacterium]|nr:hypothetical protein [Myxococcales bacterium]
MSGKRDTESNGEIERLQRGDSELAERTGDGGAGGGAAAELHAPVAHAAVEAHAEAVRAKRGPKTKAAPGEALEGLNEEQKSFGGGSGPLEKRTAATARGGPAAPPGVPGGHSWSAHAGPEVYRARLPPLDDGYVWIRLPRKD